MKRNDSCLLSKNWTILSLPAHERLARFAGIAQNWSAEDLLLTPTDFKEPVSRSSRHCVEGARLILDEIDVTQFLPGTVLHDKGRVDILDGPGRREAAVIAEYSLALPIPTCRSARCSW